MKNTIKPILFICLLAGIFSLKGCDKLREYTEGRVSTDCPDGIYADTIPNQLIIHFEPETYGSKRDDFLKWLIDDMGALNFRTCPCDSNLVLAEFRDDKVINLNTSRRQADSKLHGEDNGRVYFNYEIKFEPATGTYNVFYNNKTVQAPSDASIVVAIIDGGLNPDMFTGKSLRDYSFDFIKNETSDEDTEINTHGSIVGRIIMKNNTALPIILMDLKVFNKAGEGVLFDGLCAISHAIKNNADIINMSWGHYMPICDSLFLEYMEKTQRNDILVVASAGNDHLNTNNCLHFPSGFNSSTFTRLGNVIGVASLDKGSDSITSYSNYGSSTIGIAAYEGEVSDFNSYQGTSFAAPTVTNHAVQIIHAGVPNNMDIVKCIIESATPIPGLEVIGKGKLNTSDVTCP